MIIERKPTVCDDVKVLLDWRLITHCKMKRAKLTPKAKLAPISRGPVWPIKVRFGLFEPKRAGQVPFRPLQNLNWPL